MQCECPYLGAEHGERDCQHEACYIVTRDGQRLALCPQCTMPGDIEREDLDACEPKAH